VDTSEWQRICREAELVEGAPRLVKVGKDDVYLVRLAGRVHAMGNKCPHYGCPLNEGVLFGNVVVCKCHDARLDVTTGRMVSPPALNDLPVYPVRIKDGEVWLAPAEKPKLPRAQGTDQRTFLIVGGGAAGNAAAETLRREGFAGRIVMITAESDPPYDRPNLSKEFMSGEAKPEWMPLRSSKFYADQRIELLTNTRIISLDPRAKTASLEPGGVMSFEKVLLATGAVPRALPISGATEPGCFNLRSFADARAIVEAASTAKAVVLIGAGFIGMELASSLRARGLIVDVVAPEALPFAHMVGERVALALKKRHEENGVRFHLGLTVSLIAGGTGAKTVTLSNGVRLSADFVVFGLGSQPVVDYLTGTDLVQGGGVPVSSKLETKHPDVFAAGDIAIVPSPANGEGVRIEHWVVAERQGQHAARGMLGSNVGYDEVPFFWTRQFGVSLKYVGFAREWDKVAVRGDIEAGKFVVGYYRKGTLAAAATIGMANELTAVEVILRRRIALPPSKLADASVDLFSMARA
jgi:NADPH-dependent 2,4-dienoyl-CoA reductase/sulfur reductase-like enzyme/nitrite reductase/ring-hydroxylating ferredoxin subunit